MKIEGRTFIISGGVSGLGLATARALHSLGGYVSLLDLNSDNGNAVVSELGQRSRFFETDVTSSDAIAAAIAEAGPDDIILIAGKGHEQGQIVGDRILPFDDVAVARECAA